MVLDNGVSFMNAYRFMNVADTRDQVIGRDKNAGIVYPKLRKIFKIVRASAFFAT